MMRFLAVFAAFCCLSFSAAYATEAEAEQFAATLADDAIAILENSDLSESGKLNKLESLFAEKVDLDWVARFVLGKHWRAASKSQKETYLQHYKTFVIRNFTSQLIGYAGQDYTIKKIRAEQVGEYLLTLEITGDGEPPIYLDYRLRKKAEGYKIFDIIIEGVSLITTQRSEFSAVVERKGLDYLIAALKERSS